MKETRGLRSSFSMLLVAACMLVLFVNCKKEEQQERGLQGWDHYMWKTDPCEDCYGIEFLQHSNDLVFIKAGNMLIALKIDNGEMVWMNDDFHGDNAWEVVDYKGGVLVLWTYSTQGSGCVPGVSRKLIAFNSNDGQVLWEKCIGYNMEVKRYDDKLFYTTPLTSGGWKVGLCMLVSGEVKVEKEMPFKTKEYGCQADGFHYFAYKTTETDLNPQYRLVKLDPRVCTVEHIADFDLNDPMQQGIDMHISLSSFKYFQCQSVPYLAVGFTGYFDGESHKTYIKVIDLGNTSNQWVDQTDVDAWEDFIVGRFDDGKLVCSSYRESHGHTSQSGGSYTYYYYDLSSRRFWKTNQAAIKYYGIYLKEYDVYFYYSWFTQPFFEIRDKNGNVIWQSIGISVVSFSDGLAFLPRFPGQAVEIRTGNIVCKAFPQDFSSGPPLYQYARCYGIEAVEGGRGRRVLYANPSEKNMPGRIVCYEVCPESF